MSVPFEVNGKTYEAKLSPMAMVVMQNESKKKYPMLLKSILGVDDSYQPEDLIFFCTACLLRSWPGLTAETLFDALEMGNLSKYADGLNRLRDLAISILGIDTPQPEDVIEGKPETNSKNAVKKGPAKTPSV